VVGTLLADPVVDRLPTVGRLLRLADRFSAARLEAACARAVRYDALCYPTIKRILAEGLDQHAAPVPIPAPAQSFARSADELLGHLFQGEVAWS
jgi:hypothetical protein